MSSLPTPPAAAELERHILAGDITAVMDCIDAADSPTRAALRPTIERLVFARWKLLRPEPGNPLEAENGRIDKDHANRLFRAVVLARFLCADDLPACDYWKHIGIQDIAAYRARYAPPLPPEPIARQLQGDHAWHYAQHIHRAIVAGLVERPQTPEYIDALFFGDLRAESNLVLQHVAADPGIAPYLLQLFEREGTSDGSFAAREKYCHDPELHWSHAFLTLCERGVYTRAQLLDHTLGALACDWPQFKSGWFSRFHEQLAPIVDEMAAVAERYVALCHSRIPPTAALALQAVATLYKAGRMAAQAACDAAAPVVSSAVKGQVLAALDLLGQVARAEPGLARHAGSLAVPALAHTAADVQKKAIALCAATGLDETAQAQARAHLPFVAAVNRVALQRLVGADDGAEASVPTAAPPSPATATPQTMAQPLEAGRALAPLTQLPEVVERLAYVLENPVDVDEWERVAGALVSLAPLAAEDRPAFLALQKRTRRLQWQTKPLPFALGRVLAAALHGEPTGEEAFRVEGDGPARAEHFIGPRALSLIAQALAGRGLVPLATPTHRGGFIDPRILAARLLAHHQADAEPPMAEQVLSIMRLVPAQTDAGAAHAALDHLRQANRPSPLVLALRYALGERDVAVLAEAAQRPLFLAAARIRSPHADDAATLAAYGDLGPDGPLHARMDWDLRTTTSEYGYTFHDLHTVHTPALQPRAVGQPHHTALALCAKHLVHHRWGTEREAAHIRFAASLLPSGLEPFFAEGARALGNNLDWGEAQWQNRAYLDVLLDSTAPLGPMARLLLALALGGKEPGQSALAVDALVQCVLDGRLDVAALGDTLARLWDTPLPKGPRYAKSLGAAATAHAALPAAVCMLLCALVESPASAGRKDLAPLLELLVELSLSHRWPLPQTTRQCLGSLKTSGKGRAAQQRLLQGT